MNNMKIYQNNCKEDVLSKMQLKKEHIEYNIGKTLYATTDKGKMRNYQEDSVIIHKHPLYHDLNLIAVADGVGGGLEGDIISNYVIERLIKWFEEQENDFASIETSLKKLMPNIIKDLLVSRYAATTLSLAVITKDKTLIANIGDSRIYTYSNNRLTKETRDDSETQDLLEEKVIISEELLRFHKKNNRITDIIAHKVPKPVIKYKVIDTTYDKILAVTDGVSDCLSKTQLENIIKHSKQEEITNNIVKNALILDSYLDENIKHLSKEDQKAAVRQQKIIDDDYWKRIPGGKDNTTAAIYIRK